MTHVAQADSVVWSDQVATSTESWHRFYHLFSRGTHSTGLTVFLHERVSGSGNSRLVAINLYGGPIECVQMNVLIAEVFVPGSLFSRPRAVNKAEGQCVGVDDMATIYAGEADATDRSHFVIKYEAPDGRRHTLDGWLTDDDRVVLEERKPELASVTP